MNYFIHVLSKINGPNVAKVTGALATTAVFVDSESPTDAAIIGVGTAILAGGGTHAFQTTGEALSKRVLNRSLSIPARAAFGLAGACTTPVMAMGVGVFALVLLGINSTGRN